MRAASAVLWKSSQMICRSTAVPAQTQPRTPSSVLKPFSGEVEGLVISLPFSSSNSMCMHASVAPFITGYTWLRYSRSRVKL